jgi:hypothetical protein
MSGYYPPNARAPVVVAHDPFAGRVGTVDRTFNDGGDMVHRVQFGDGNCAYYEAHELRYARAAARPSCRRFDRDR